MKLIRDPKCRPALRGILESLLRYLTEDLAKRTPRTASPDLQSEAFVNRTKTFERSSNNFNKFCLDSRENRLPTRSGGDLGPKDQIRRRLTTFQLLQSKFLKSSPKPCISHQREVGTLSSGRGSSRQDKDTKRDTRDHTKREQGPKRRGSVKEMVAKFAMAEQKEQGLKTQKKEPRQFGRGILLSSLVETFENVAIVRKKGDLKFSHEKLSGGVRDPSTVKEKVDRLERGKERPSDQTDKQNPLKQTERGQKPRPGGAVNIFTKENLCTEGEIDLKTEQTHIPKKMLCSRLKHNNNQTCEENVKDGRSAQFSEIQTTSNEADAAGRTVRFGCQEFLSSTSASEWSPPQPGRALLREEPPLTWHVATAVTCSPVRPTCVHSSLAQNLREAFESPNLDKKTRNTTNHDLRSASRGSAADESLVNVPETDVKQRIEAVANRDVNLPMTGEKGCSIPFNGANQITGKLSSQTDPSPLTKNLQFQRNVTALDTTSERFQDVDSNGCCYISKPGLTEEKSLEENVLEVLEKGKGEWRCLENRDFGTPQSSGLSVDTTDDDAFKDRELSLTPFQPKRDNKQKPKYTTINYGDPSVKETYKPKIIRFADTFDF